MQSLSSTTTSPRTSIQSTLQRVFHPRVFLGRAAVLDLRVLRQRHVLWLAITLVIGVFGVILRTGTAHAATAFSIESVGSQVGLGNADLKETVLNVIRWALGIVSLLAVAYVIYGGFLWLTAAGNEQRVEKAKQVILQAVIGIVIILLAWAIVFFVARTLNQVTDNTKDTGTTTGCTDINNCNTGGPTSTFDITAVNTCSSPPDSWKDVPRSSAVSFTFNTDLKTATSAATMTPPETIAPANDPIKKAVEAGELQIQKCSNVNCTGSPISLNPAPIDGQVYTPGDTTSGTAAAPKAEWLAINNTLSFYHLSLKQCQGGGKNGESCTADPDCTDGTVTHICKASDRLFEPTTTYRVSIPKDSNNQTLRDVRDRTLQLCRSSAGLGGNIPHCDDSSDPQNILYTFTTGVDSIGQPLQVANTVPASEYLTNSALKVDRSVARTAILGITFSSGVDPISVNTENFRVYKITGTPENVDKGTCGGGACPGKQIDPSKYSIRINDGGNGAWLQFTSDKEWYEPYTWYRVEVENMRNLCGTTAPKQTWAFETNDVTPGVDYVYPSTTTPEIPACPSTEVFVQFKTSMWNITKGARCDLGTASTYDTATMVYDQTANKPVISRTFAFTDTRTDPSDDPNNYCQHLSFDPTSAGLPTDHNYSGAVKAHRTVDQNGTLLGYGDAVPGFDPPPGTPPWHFSVKPPGECFQRPYITDVSPGHDGNGACLSVEGNYFEKVGQPDTKPNLPDAGDALKLSTEDQTGNVKAWTDSSIVHLLNSGGLATNATYDYQVSVAYPSPAGIMKSPISVADNFRLDAGAAANRPCLTSLNPNEGYPGETKFSASGDNFGTVAGSIKTDNASPWIVTGPWTNQTVNDILVKASPPTAAPRMSKVRVVNSAGIESNELPFNVLAHAATIPGAGNAPTVVENATCNAPATIPSPNPYKADTNACINSKISVEFSIPIDATTVKSTTAGLFSCAGTTCATNVPTTLSVVGDRVNLEPIDDLRSATTYEVRLAIGIKATPDAPFTPGTGVPMAAPYSWKFTTKTDPNPCVLSEISLSPNDPQAVQDKDYTAIGLQAVPVDNECHSIKPAGLKFNWTNSNTQIGNLINAPLTNTDDDTKTLAPPATAPGSTDVTVSAQSHTSNKFTLTYNPTACVTSADCTENSLGESCGVAKCEAGSCTPVINAIDKNSGPVGSWTTVKGCWFGSYDADKSKIKFSPAIDAVLPNPAECGTGTWTNERIVREVPAGAQSGPMSLVRNDGVTASSTGSYTVNTSALEPGLCKLAPVTGLRDDQLTLDGRGYATKGTGDAVTFTPLGTTTSTSTTLFPASGWADKKIVTAVPSSAVQVVNEVRVIKGAQSSNPLPYEVLSALPASCTTACTDDSMCGTGQGCSYPGDNGLGCCMAKPTITAVAPPAAFNTNICRNTQVDITFSQPLDPQTVTPDTVRYYDSTTQRNGDINVNNTDATGTITYSPGLLSVNSPQQVLLTRAALELLSFDNQSFDETGAGNKPDKWQVANTVTQSTETAPNHNGFSALVDSRSSTQQGYIYQNISTSTVPVTSTDTYKISGWVKAIVGAKSSVGFVPQCDNLVDCGFNINKGGIIYTGVSSNGWEHVSFLVHRASTASVTAQLRITCYANAGSAIWCDDITLEKQIDIPTTGIRSARGVLADVTDSPVTFRTGPNICAVDRVSVKPPDDRFVAKNETHPGFSAQAYPSDDAAPIDQVTGTYEWNWDWLSTKPAVATSQMTSTANSNPSKASVTAVANGTTMIQARTSITKDTINHTDVQKRQVTGQSQVDVEFCNTPWQFDDSAQNCDINNGNTTSCPKYNFRLYYCGDKDSGTSLPMFNYAGTLGSPVGSIEGVNTTDPNRLKSYFFKATKTSRDTIGLLIFKNDEFLSPSDWFAKRFPLDTSAATTVVAGYPAVKTGTTTYIGVTNLGDDDQLHGLMFVLDYNSNNASPETVDIAAQLVEHVSFNTNLSNVDDKTKVANDTKRRQDLASLQLSLQSYKTKNGSYPSLAAGTYISGFTTSLWPSWQTTLGVAVSKTLPTDPLNKFSATCPAGSEGATCWAESSKTFSCPNAPTDSHLYAYKIGSTGVDLYTTMEYTGTGKFIGTRPSAPICSAPSTCDCFNYVLHIGS